MRSFLVPWRARLPDRKSQKKAAQYTSGALTGIGMLCILLAKNWVVLSIGWAALAVCIVLGSLNRIKRSSPQGELRFEVGPLITADLEKIKTWIKPVAILVLLLGIAGLVVPVGKDGSPPQSGYAVFLIGLGVACLGIGFVNRALIVTGYGLWAVAGGIVTYTAFAIESPLGMAQALTLGILLIVGGGLAAYGFLYGRTGIYDEGILLANGMCSWQQIDQWTTKTINHSPHLQVTIGSWKPVMAVRPDQVDSLQAFLTEKFHGRSRNDEAEK